MCIKFLQKKFRLIAIFTSSIILFSNLLTGQAITPQNHLLGAKLLSPASFASLPKVNWDTLRKYAPNKKPVGGITPNSINGNTMLINPPIGDQGTEGSCVGWAVGYSALGVLTYPKFNCWDVARRSPNYVYNQIKATTDCASGSYVTDALNLVKNQGDCSWNLMPYVNGNCTAVPTPAQTADAAANKALNWGTVAYNNVTPIRNALDLGYPVVISFKVYQSFYDMFNTAAAIWSSNTGTYFGNHATCIVGYDNVRQMFKVQNQWGLGGDHGFFWIPFGFIGSGCLSEAYILYATTPLVPMDIIGANSVCTTSQYTVSNLPVGAAVTWASDNNTMGSVSATGLVTKGTGTGTFTLSATIAFCGGTNTVTITKIVIAGSPYAAISAVQGTCNGLYMSWQLSVSPTSYGTGWNWSVGTLNPNSSITISNPNSSSTSISVKGGGAVSLHYTGVCGNTMTDGVTVYSTCHSFAIVASPNPANGRVNVRLLQTGDATAAEIKMQPSAGITNLNSKGITRIQLYDFNSGKLVKEWKYAEISNGNYNLNVAAVKKGVYVLKIDRDNQSSSSEKIILK
jgi:Secretion system C-terminal sorting domain